MNQDRLLGRVVIAKQGRDADKFFIIVGILDNVYVQIADGNRRKVEKPKKKKLIHIELTSEYDLELRKLLLENIKITNSKIRKIIKSVELDKEV